jgi:hypothetical protein
MFLPIGRAADARGHDRGRQGPDHQRPQLRGLASGRADRLSGRHLSVTDSLDALLHRIDQVERDDLHTLRLRTSH